MKSAMPGLMGIADYTYPTWATVAVASSIARGNTSWQSRAPCRTAGNGREENAIRRSVG